MASRSSLQHATMEAARIHARLGTPRDRPVDVFEIVQRMRIWLTSQRLGNLYGFYLNDGDVSGIVLNSQHPESLQRYTCAHELGHHVLGHSDAADVRGDVLDRSHGQNREAEAQAFAGALLMPLPLVNRILNRLSLRGKSTLAIEDVYQVSRELDVSFTAAAWGLVNLNILRPELAVEYVAAGAAVAKDRLRGADPVTDARADVFTFDRPVQDFAIACRVGDEIRLRLSENRSTGYLWRVAAPRQTTRAARRMNWDGEQIILSTGTLEDEVLPDSELSVVLDQVIASVSRGLPAVPVQPLDVGIGEETLREFVLVAVRAGATELRLTCVPAWSIEDDASAVFAASVRIVDRHRLNGFASEQVAARVEKMAG